MFEADAALPTSGSTCGQFPSRARSLALTLLTAALVCAAVTLGGARSALAAQSTTYSAQQTIPVPPASDFSGSAGGDGWALALSATQVFNVFHHNSQLQVVCHNQSDASTCWGPTTITDGSGDNFATGGQPGMYLDRATGKLYIYATREDGGSGTGTGGVVCVDTTQGATSSDPFCGFTALTGTDEATVSGYGELTDPALIGNHWYAFNFVPGANLSGTRNTLLCFDVSTDAACAGQPYTVAFGATGTMDAMQPAPGDLAVGGRVIIPLSVNGTPQITCFDDSTQSTCAGSWPVNAPSGYVGNRGAPFPLVDTTGTPQGFCVPDANDDCFSFTGDSVATPAGMTAAIPPSGESVVWNGPGLTVGPRVYVPEWQNTVYCYDASTQGTCSGFPKSFTNLGGLYTVNADYQRPTCIWVNADDQSAQIQNFDAYTGGACGQGAIRVLASQFIVPNQACYPTSYSALQVIDPAPGSYTSGSLTFQDGDGNPIPGASDLSLDGTGSASLVGLNLNTATGLPQFVIALAGTSGSPGQVTVKLTWTAPYDPSCVGAGITAVAPVTPPAGGGVIAPGNAKPPTVSGTALPGHVLTCSPGTWTGSPTSFTYTWTRDGQVISGATGSTYTIGVADEAKTIGCQVTARNAAGAGKPAGSAGLVVGRRHTLTCAKPTGRLSGTGLGVFSLGLSQSQARKRLHRFHRTQNGFDNFCLFAGWGIRVAYPSPHLLGTLSKGKRGALRGHIVLELTANRFYALHGVRPQTRLAQVRRHLNLARPFHVGSNDWYFLPGKVATGVLKVRNGVIREVGLANLSLTRTRDQQRQFIRSFPDV